MQFREVVRPGQEDWASGLVIILTVQETVCLDREGKYISVGAWILALSLQNRTCVPLSKPLRREFGSLSEVNIWI